MADQYTAHSDSAQRLTQRYRFADASMDLFFLCGLSWAPAGGLSVGGTFYVASQITDGDADSWSQAFEHQGEVLVKQANEWLARGQSVVRGLTRAAGEARLEAFTCYRQAWQFEVPGKRFTALFKASQTLFRQSVTELGYGATCFSVAYGGGELPGHYFPATGPHADTAPTILVIGGADTCHEDRFVAGGRFFLERGYTVVLVDLPGQSNLAEQGLHWEMTVEKPLAAVIDLLVARFAVVPRRLALLGMSLGGYFACRAAAHEPRLAAVIATPALPKPPELLEVLAKVEAARASATDNTSTAERNNFAVHKWKAGVDTFADLHERWKGVAVDPAQVHVPFLTVLGMQEGDIWKRQCREWDADIQSTQKRLIDLDSSTGADAHCQVNNPLRLVQEVDGWLHEFLWEV